MAQPTAVLFFRTSLQDSPVVQIVLQFSMENHHYSWGIYLIYRPSPVRQLCQSHYQRPIRMDPMINHYKWIEQSSPLM